MIELPETTRGGVSYRLGYHVVEYGRRNGPMSSLLFSLAQQLLLWEAEGKVAEELHCHLTSEGDFRGVCLIDDPTVVPRVEAAA